MHVRLFYYVSSCLFFVLRYTDSCDGRSRPRPHRTAAGRRVSCSFGIEAEIRARLLNKRDTPNTLLLTIIVQARVVCCVVT
jgi:hypothetical protein